jgi:hypothetical protein
VLVRHKVTTAYTTRKVQGKSQLTHERGKSGGGRRSAGGALRARETTCVRLQTNTELRRNVAGVRPRSEVLKRPSFAACAADGCSTARARSSSSGRR